MEGVRSPLLDQSHPVLPCASIGYHLLARLRACKELQHPSSWGNQAGRLEINACEERTELEDFVVGAANIAYNMVEA